MLLSAVAGSASLFGCATSSTGEDLGAVAAPVVFQDGVSPSTSYAGETDTTLQQSTPTTAHASDVLVRVDHDYPDATRNVAEGALRFDLSSIPVGATITSVTLTLNITNPTTGTVGYSFYPLERAWTASEATWTGPTTGTTWQAPGAEGISDRSSSAIAQIAPTVTGKLAVPFNAAGIAAVQKWVSSPAINFGFVMDSASDPDGITFDSAKGTTPANHPQLSIGYTTPATGTGAGLLGQYYTGTNFQTLVTTRIDATVGFNWGTTAPAPGIPSTGYSVRWTGQVEALYTQTYTFSTTSDDGARLWINGQELVNNWRDHAATVNSGTIALTAGQKYDVKYEFYQNAGAAEALLAWSSPSQASQIIPTSQLYPAAGPVNTCAQPSGTGIVAYQSLSPLGTTTGTGASGRLAATVGGIPTNEEVSFAPGTYEIYDFADPANYPVYGAYFPAKVLGLAGSCASATIFQLHPYSSTKASLVPTPAQGGINPLSVLRFDAKAVNLSGFTINATEQGHAYNGLILYETTAAKVTNVKIKGFIGLNGAPPGETFSLNNYRANDTTLSGVELDGTDANGVKVAASLMGNNYVSNLTVNDSYLHDAQFGAGITEYECTGAFNYNRVKTHNNNAGFNFEQFSAGTININACDFAGNNHDLIVDSNISSTKVTITNPVLPASGKLTILIHKYYDYPPKPAGQQSLNKQLQSDVTLTVNGVSRPDLINFVSN